MNQKRCNTLLPLVQLLPAVAAAAAVLFALPHTTPVLAAVPERLAAVVEQPVEVSSSEAEEEALPKLPYADGVYVGSSRGYGGAVRVQVTMENGSITEVEILDASHETKQFLRRAKRLLTTADGSEYGLHHVTNIWHGTKLGFNADDPYFASIIGKTITQITFYAADGVYVLPVNVAL